MAGTEVADGVRFGRTVIRAATGDAVDQPVQAIVYPANARGMMGAGPLGSIRLVAGPEVEREAMAAAPHDLGSAFVSGSGRLSERGIEAVIHAVVSPALGTTARLETVRRSLSAALRAADRKKLRSVAVPLIGASADAPPAERASIAEAIVDEMVSYLRRETSRLDLVMVLSRFDDDLPVVASAIQRARERSWTT